MRAARRHARLSSALALLAALFLQGVHAAVPFPERAVRFIVPWPPGGGADFVSRVVALKLSERLGHNVVVDNRGGAGGVIGTELAAKAPADGYTWVLLTAPSTISPALHPRLGFDVVKDFAPVSMLASAPYVVACHPSLGARSLAELISLAKTKPGQINFSSSGIGSAPHLAGELLNVRTGMRITHVPYKGTGPAVADTLAGHVQMTIANLVPMIPHVRSGRLRALAVTSLQRTHHLPDVPTVAESGAPGFEIGVWYGIAMRAGTPGPLVTQLNREINQVVRDREIEARLSQEGAQPFTMTSPEFSRYIGDELKKWAEAVRVSGAKAG